MRRALPAVLALLAAVPCPVVADDLATPFAGEWAAFRPGGEDRTLVTCPSPVSIEAAGSSTLAYHTYSGPLIEVAIAADGETLTWTTPEERQQVRWSGPDEFTMTALVDGVPAMDKVFVYHRCPVFPRTSYVGAPDGLAAPFAGNWRLETPAFTANRPNDVLVNCDQPIFIAASGDDTIVHQAPDSDRATAKIVAHDGHTDWRIDGVKSPWEVVWIDPDRFTANTIGIDRVTEWRLPMIYIRCGT